MGKNDECYGGYILLLCCACLLFWVVYLSCCYLFGVYLSTVSLIFFAVVVGGVLGALSMVWGEKENPNDYAG